MAAKPSLSDKSAAGKSRALAARDLEDIEALKKFPPFTRWFGRRITEELEKKREVLLYDRTLDKDKLWELRLEFLAAYDIAQMLIQDEAGCKSVIGIEPEE